MNGANIVYPTRRMINGMYDKRNSSVNKILMIYWPKNIRAVAIPIEIIKLFFMAEKIMYLTPSISPFTYKVAVAGAVTRWTEPGMSVSVWTRSTATA